MTNETGARFAVSGRTIAMSGGEAGPGGACFACHGLGGQGDGHAAPRLAGLSAGYLQKQLSDYALGLREDAVMGPIARRLDDRARQEVAQYYAGLPSAPPPLAGAPSGYLKRPEDPAAPACADCHGIYGEGRGLGNPALAGQPPAYVAEQLRRWRRAERRNDPQGVMSAAAAQLTAQEVAAIAAWLAAGPPAPGSGSAAPRAARASVAAGG